MDWRTIQARFKELSEARDSGAPFTALWDAYREAVLASRDNPPYHLIVPLRIVEDAAARSCPQDVRILDHGCGGGGTLFYFLALGYTGIFGVDLGGNSIGWNRLLREELKIEGPRFFIYEGKVLPFGDGSFDVVISEEVVEHVPDSTIISYYSEAARVLRPDGIAYYTVPHRLAPYDSHSRTWFIHYLPRRIASRLYGAKGSYTRDFFDNHLFLRWPIFHRTKMRELYGSSIDLTNQRLLMLTKFDYYDGPRGLRQWLGRAARIPLAGPLLSRAIGLLLMRQTLSRKRPGAFPATYQQVVGRSATESMSEI